jgi:hypothetical protein
MEHVEAETGRRYECRDVNGQSTGARGGGLIYNLDVMENLAKIKSWQKKTEAWIGQALPMYTRPVVSKSVGGTGLQCLTRRRGYIKLHRQITAGNAGGKESLRG